MISSLLLLAILALPVAAVAVTITKTGVFAPLRNWLLDHWPFLGKLFSCPYCLIHWLSFGLIIVYRPKLIGTAWLPLELVLSAFALVALSTMIAWIIYTAYQQMIRPTYAEENEELRQALELARDTIVSQEAQIQELTED